MSASTTPKVPGTYIFDVADSTRGYALNRLFGSFKDPKNRAMFTSDEAAYCDAYSLNPEQKEVILQRDWTRMLDLGGSIFYVFKLAVMDKKSMQDLGGIFTGMTTEEFVAALSAGGRNFG